MPIETYIVDFIEKHEGKTPVEVYEEENRYYPAVPCKKFIFVGPDMYFVEDKSTLTGWSNPIPDITGNPTVDQAIDFIMNNLILVAILIGLFLFLLIVLKVIM